VSVSVGQVILLRFIRTELRSAVVVISSVHSVGIPAIIVRFVLTAITCNKIHVFPNAQMVTIRHN
jgi:hypothetical protein